MFRCDASACAVYMCGIKYSIYKKVVATVLSTRGGPLLCTHLAEGGRHGVDSVQLTFERMKTQCGNERNGGRDSIAEGIGE